jgi:hypothetical protein
MAHRAVSSSSLIDAIRLDVSDKDIFGREQETAILHAALERVSEPKGKPKLILLKGRGFGNREICVSEECTPRCCEK